MKKINLFILAMLPTLAMADIITTIGDLPCGRWVESRSKGYDSNNISWLVGYLSGISTGLDKNFLEGSDNSSIFLWMDNYCRNNPLSRVSIGAAQLSIIMMREKGMSFHIN